MPKTTSKLHLDKLPMRSPVQPSVRTLKQLIGRNSELIGSMAIHIRSSQGIAPSQWPGLPSPLLFVPVRKVSVAGFQEAIRPASHTWGGFVVLQWPDGLSATLQIAYLRVSTEANKCRWIPLTLASGSLARTLLRYSKKSAQGELVLVSVPSLRLQALVRFGPDSADEPTEPTVTFIQPGITRLSNRRSFSKVTAERLIAGEANRLAAHAPPLPDRKEPRITGNGRLAV